MNSLAPRALGAALILSACASPQPQTANTGDFYGGAPLGARAAAEDALQTALEKNISGRQVSWETTGGFGFLTPVETWKSTSGHWCRRFNETISVNGSPRDRTAVACRVNGRWRLAEEA